MFTNIGASATNYKTNLGFVKWGIFGTLNYQSVNERFKASLGLRADASSYSSVTEKMWNHVSPRLSLSYRLAGGLNIGTNVSRYYQLAPLTALGYKNNAGDYVNKNLKYMRADQLSGGFNYTYKNTIELSIEGFYKRYGNMPQSVADGIPLMCKGDDYGVIGNELLTSTSKGQSYGLEFLGRWIIMRKLNVSTSFTLFKSKFDNSKGESVYSAWDSKYIFNLTGTYYFKKNWSVGAKLKSVGGAPYTPYDLDKTSLVEAWNASGKPYFDYSRYNTLRNPSYTQLDLRVDKIFYIKRYMLGFYIDIQNVTKSSFKRQDIPISNGAILNPSDPIEKQRYGLKEISQESSTMVPTLGVTFEF